MNSWRCNRLKLNLKIKKKYIIFGGITLIVLALLLLLWTVTANSKDGAKFKREYEAYNGEKSSSGKKYQTLKIDRKNKVKYSDLKSVNEIIENGTGLIYFGFPNCPWCRGMLPTLLDVLDCSCLDELLYVNMSDLRDEFKVVDGKAKETKEASREYYDLLKLLDDHLDDYIVEDKDGFEYETGEKRVYVPLVVAVKNGEIIRAFDGIDLEKGASPYDELTKIQKSELEAIFSDMVAEISKVDTANVCDEHC